MSETIPDLTRWNRAGLSRFRYVAGNAATFLEILRSRLNRNFPDYQAVETPPAETEEERNLRLLEAYRADSSDWAWLIARELARAAHILTEYLDAYANEGYLPSATQWDHLRRLVELIDYHPAPPASAVTRVALTVKAGAAAQVKKGLALGCTPPDGKPPLVFETLEDLDADAALNLLRPDGWDRNPGRLRAHELELEGAVSGVKAGQPLILENEMDGVLQAYTVQGVRELADRTVVTVSPRLPNHFRKGWTKVYLVAADKLAVRGPLSTTLPPGAVHLTEVPTGLMAQEVVWMANAGQGCFVRVKSVSGGHVLLDAAHSAGPIPTLPAGMGPPLVLPVSGRASRPIDTEPGSFYFCRTPGDWSRLQKTLAAHVTTTGELRTVHVVAAKYHPVTDGTGADPFEGYTVLTLHGGTQDAWLDNPQSILVQPEGTLPWTIDQFLLLSPTLDIALPRKAAAGDFAVLAEGRQLAWGRITHVAGDPDANIGTLTVDRWRTRGGGPFFSSETLLHAHFSKTARVFGWQLNATPLSGARVPLAAVPAALRPGRKLVVSIDESARLFTSCSAIEGQTLVLADALPAGATCHNTAIRANIVLAGHGQTRDAKTLGSGDATQSFQEFFVPDSPVSFVPDSAMPAGVRADLNVAVDGRTWQEVAAFADAGPTDVVYITRITEDGKLRVIFGDGRRGRRLPTGQNNVRVRCRVGSGPDGNLPAGSLKLSRPHPLVASVEQLLPALGGAAQEAAASLRDNAPHTLLALDRAVSAEDFASLAASRSSVAQAAALPATTGSAREQAVEVVVVPAGAVIARGAAVTLGALGESLWQFLMARAAPGVQVSVSPFSPVRVALRVVVRVDATAFDPEVVAASARAGLEQYFGLERRQLAQPLYLSEVYEVVESITGVENSLCRILHDSEIDAAENAGTRVHLGSDGFISSLVPTLRQAVYLASSRDLVLTYEVLTR